MLSLNFMRGPKRRAKSSGTLTKIRPEIRRVQDVDSQLIRSQVSFEVLDINEKSARKASVENSTNVDLEPSTSPEDTLQTVSLPSSPDPPPTPPSKHCNSPRVEVDLPEDSSGLDDWFPPHLLQARGSAVHEAAPLEDASPTLASSSLKKHAPSPIKIPNHALHGPKVQVDRSSISASARSQSRPGSTISLDEMSTISGTTLARALIGSDFVFPNDARSSRYRSGMTTLTRQDSATLPRGDDPLINSPYWRDRRISGGEIIRTPDPNNEVPPVPALPAALRSRPHSNVMANEQTNGQSDSQGDSFTSASHRTSPEHSEPPSSTVPDSASLYPPTISAYDGVSLSPSGSQQLLSPRSVMTSMSTSSAMDDVLDYYQFAPGSSAQHNVVTFSPIIEASTSAEASRVPSPYTASSEEIDRSSLVSSVPSIRAASHKSNSVKRLPIGSSGQYQERQSGSNSISELQPPPRPNVNRGRSGSAPSPIIVVRDSKDFTRYNITVSPVPESMSPSASTDEHYFNNSGKQTFPETPRAFSPLWSPEPLSEGLVQRAASASEMSTAELTRAMSARRAESSHTRVIHRAASFNTKDLAPPAATNAPALLTASPTQAPTTSHETVRHATDPITPSQPEHAPHSKTPIETPGFSYTRSNDNPTSLASASVLPIDTSSRSPSPASLNPYPIPQSRRPSDAGLPAETDAGSITFSLPYGAPPPYTFVDLDASTPQHHSHDSLASESSLRSSVQRSRIRPPLPLGPRRPSVISGPIHSPSLTRDRNGSVSSASSSFVQTPRGGSTRQTTHIPTPRFAVPPPKFKGLTIDHAKWTFTSAELQSIVSQAIRKSAEVSSIRLLPLEVIQDKLPEELSRLEIQREDLKLRYKLLARKRSALISGLIGQTEVEEGESLSAAQSRMLEELGHVSMQADQVAEELYSVGEQITQLVTAREVHSYSALAMALRKLNTSFAKQVADAQELRMEIETLRQERDTTWEQLERIAHDYDNLLERGSSESGAPTSSSRRSSRAMAQRRSTIRVQAVMRSSSIIRSRRSSASSSAIAHLSMSSIGSASRSHFMVPPVPPIPWDRPQPPVINVDVSRRESTALTESSTHENSAMAQVQQELYEMLGMVDEHGLGRLHHRRSCGGETCDPNSLKAQAAAEIRRPSSLPDHTIEDTSSVNTAMLNTLALLAPN